MGLIWFSVTASFLVVPVTARFGKVGLPSRVSMSASANPSLSNAAIEASHAASYRPSNYEDGASTLSSLQLLLQATTLTADNAGPNSRPAKKIQSTTTAMSVARTKSTRSAKYQSEAKVESLQTAANSQDTAGLTAQQRLVLATEIFNTASKALVDALQRNNSQKSPLQPTSPNRVVSSTKQQSTKPLKTASTGKGSSADGIKSTAECAIFALATLRNAKSENAPNTGHQNLQLEQGVCILAGRLTALGLSDLAYKELKALKKRLQEYMLPVSAKNSKKSTARSAQDAKTEPEKEIAAELLTFSDMASAAPILSVLLQFQINVLKLAMSDKRILITHKTCKALATCNPSSPANLVLQSLDSGGLGKDKAALQLLSISNTILSLSNTLHKTLTAVSETTTNRGERAFSTLTLQLLSMEYRVMSWELSGHQGDSKREYWDPLSRFLDLFSNYGSKMKSSDFAELSTTLQRLHSRMAKSQMRGAGNSWKISYSLGKIAQDASCLQEALKHFLTATEIVTAEYPMASSLIKCRIAFTHLCLLKGNKAYGYDLVVESLATAALGIKSANKGNANDLEALLVESAKLKKLAMASLGESVSSEKALPDKMVMAIVEFLHAFIRFLRRYISRLPQSQAESEANEQLQSLTGVKNIIMTAAESAVALGKMSLLNQVPAWELLQPVFSDCARLLNSFEDFDADAFNEGFNWRASIVKLSNLFWSRYLKRREAGQGYEELIPLLDQSVGLLKGCPAAERIAGFAALKLERLAHLYLDARMGAKSIVCFERSIQEHIDAGVLQEHIAFLSGRPPHTCLHDLNSPGYNLTRLLSSYLKMQLRRPSNDDHSVFDNKTLDILARGTLLEWQLGLLTEFYSHDADTEKFKELLQKLLSEVLSLYTGNQYPSRRLRVIRLALRFVLDHPNSLDNAITESLTEDAASHLSNQQTTLDDVELENYAPNIRTSLSLIISLRDGNVKIDSFREIITFWASTIRTCTSWDYLQSVIDDCDLLVAQLNAVWDYLEARGYWKLHLAVGEVLLRIFELQRDQSNSSLLLVLSRCALQYCRLGDQKAASSLLERAKQYLNSGNMSCYALMTYQLAVTEYNLEIGNIDHAENAMLFAQKLYQSKEARKEMSETRSQSKIAWERLIVDGALLYSRIADQRGCLKKALYYGKLSVRLTTRLWAKLERSAGKKRESEQLTEKLSDVDLVIDGVANINLSEATAPSAWSYAEGAVFWRHIASHNACFLNLMRLSAHNGLFQDAIYYGEQALKVNKTLGASFRLLACQAELGLEWIRGNHISEAKHVLDAATKLSEELINSVEMVKLKISLAALSRTREDYEGVLRLLREAETMLGRITEVRLDPSLGVKSSDTGIEGKLADMRIRQASIQKESQLVTSRQTRRTKATSKITSKEEEDESISSNVQMPSQSLIMLRNEIFRQQIHTLLAIEDLDGASRVLDVVRECSPSAASQISLQIEETEHLLADAMKSITTHAIYCVLPESTLSMPSIEGAVSIANPPVLKSKTPATRKGKSTFKEPRSRTTKVAKKEVDITNIMSHARNAISKTVRDAVSIGSTMEGHTASGLMGRISMLLHATKPGLVDEDILAPVNANELGRITAFDRERLAICIDKSLSGYSDPMSWPSSMNCNLDDKPDIITNFAQNYVDILPSSWNVLSISMNSDRTEFIISKICRGSPPFLLRLPVRRGEEENEDEDDFTFDLGKNEMKEIIRLANASAHDAKSRTDKKSKKQWWTTRESLDRRLETLLDNMENIWLGGFRGIFDAIPRNSLQLAQFARSFETILDKHLPSRRKSKAVKEKIKVHENVLSLFIGLRGLEKQENPEDSVLDLLYFVVDILQFQGERNAYDEIDFDMMVIDTLDILNGFHCSDEADIEPPNHTILILDKSLHAFPWESLPCLHGLPVSRMPSLECLRERIIRFRSSEELPQESFEIDSHNGHFILNPSGDLKTTQTTFEEDFSHMKGWSAVIGRAPSEEEFKSGLEDKDIFLYFGHGSGAQYIRGRTIKRLDKCAVAFLMGCSSGCLTEAGELEPYGTPMNYMQAGSPALVATLWDVTDKDIDRFAKSTFQQWGLLKGVGCQDTGTVEQKGVCSKNPSKASKGKEVVRAECERRSNSLDEAVAQSRNSCLLKYLNGAAPVIYGIPVYLSK
ncbi:hypothetical protein UA08_05147 [Talaromyces atroroseus]|uniref:separase n=1 Tax=Talaromyces atroroseus TaxID=1441469 RepID=A0A225AME3_TALAT|nr:hypothetical protein UA08_05147 [Talaromyces atroroseus]OKL59504.1 hypothetical protein UA08_05147 [Talaromyces atroroseus]